MNYLDRFLSVCAIRKTQLQLLGTACLLLSSKLRQPFPLSSEHLVYYTDNSISVDDLCVSTQIHYACCMWCYSYCSVAELCQLIILYNVNSPFF
jgi:hypothetical protein